jgi:hypothetical protein
MNHFCHSNKRQIGVPLLIDKVVAAQHFPGIREGHNSHPIAGLELELFVGEKPARYDAGVGFGCVDLVRMGEA